MAIHKKSGSALAPQAHTRGGDGAQASAYDPQSIVTQLGPGQSFSGKQRSRMESVFGRDFSNVRLHTDSNAAQMSRNLDAQAFTVGHHVAFASGRYQPGTVIGDALMAHELAHVTQQSNASPSAVAMQSSGAEYDALERDADATAASAVVSLWGRAKGLAGSVTSKAMPRMQSGMRLSLVGCKGGDSGVEKVPAPEKKAATCDDICSRAKADSKLNDSAGGVICDGATKCACLFDYAPLGIVRGECPELDATSRRHEERHLSDVDCDASKGLHRPPFRDPAKATESECAHRTEQRDALTEAIKKAVEPCKTKLTSLRDAQDAFVKSSCGGGP
jgi:hypothetical protein